MTARLEALVAALAAGYGAYLLFTSVVLGWRRSPAQASSLVTRVRARVRDRLAQAGMSRVRLTEFVAVMIVLAAVGGAAGFAVFGGMVPSVALASAGASVPLLGARNRRLHRISRSRDVWPRLIEDVRVQVVTLGRSVPAALWAVGRRSGDHMQEAFAAAEREWHVSTDLERSLDVLKSELADPTADAVSETLIVAHALGGSDVDSRLRALIDDRLQDLQGRKDARSKQAGVRFARLFVLIVPFGMALVGLSIGEGRDAYAEPTGQAFVVLALALMGLCWLWAGHLLKLPDEPRVFAEEGRR